MDIRIIRSVLGAPALQEILGRVSDGTLDKLCSQPLEPNNGFIAQVLRIIQEFELPWIRAEWNMIHSTSTSTIPNVTLHLLHRIGNAYLRTKLCDDLLSLSSQTQDFRERNRRFRRLSAQLYILDASKYGKTQLERWFDKVLQPGLAEDPTNLDHYLGQLTPTYLHTYTELPTSIYKQCFHHEEARGSYGAVTEVEELSTGRRLAMKTLEGPKYLPMRLENYLGELVILRVCDHPNLLRVVDAFRTGERKLHFVIEPWAPYTLHSFLYSPDAERREMFKWFKPDDEFSTIKICHWMLGLAGGLGFLHDRSIKHKDIKPQNILLHFEEDSTIQPILADVGKGKVWHEGASSGYADSTRMFLAPEQIRCRDPKSTLQADVWQLGCCFAILLALACGGTSASHSLHFTFGSVAKPPNCISLNREIFLAELDTICVGKPHVSEALPIVKAMLAEEPERRLKIVEVTKRLNGLLYPWE